MSWKLWIPGAALLAGFAGQQPAQAQPRPNALSLRRPTVTTTPKPTVLACNMDAMTPIQKQRYDRIVAQLRREAKQVKELPDGYAFRYTHNATLFLAAAEFITLESRCCSFYHFRLEQEPEEGSMWLSVTGPAGAKSFIKPFLAPQ